MKKIISIIFALIITCGCVSVAFADGTGRTIVDFGKCGLTENDNVTWTVYDDGELVISGSGAMASFDSKSCKTAPWTKYLEKVWCVTVEEGVNRIGNYAFSGSDNSGVTTYRIAESVVSIGLYSLKAFGETGRNKTSIVYAGSPENWKKVSGSNFEDRFIVTFNNEKLAPFIKFTENEIALSKGSVATLYYDSYLGKYNKGNPVFETSDGVEVISSSGFHIVAVNNSLKRGTLTAKIVDPDGKAVCSDSVALKINFGAIFTYPLELILGLPYYGLYFFIIGIPLVIYEIYDKVIWWR